MVHSSDPETQERHSWFPSHLFAGGGTLLSSSHIKIVEVNPIMQHFAFDHLPAALQEVSRPIGELATRLNSLLVPDPEAYAGLRKLLEARDCFVRAAVSQKLTGAPTHSHRARVAEDLRDLKDRLSKLDAFILDNPLFLDLDAAEQDRLRRQSRIMGDLSNVLDERLAAFG